MSGWLLAALVALAFVVALTTTPLIAAAARRWGFLDRPNPRSSHTRTTARGGGLAIVLAVGVCLAATAGDWGDSSGHGAFLLGAVALAVVGLCDDRFGTPIVLRLVAQTGAAVTLVVAAGSPASLPLPPPLDAPLGVLGGPLAVLWIVSVVNFYNFMDGIDGLAGVQAVLTGLGLALVSWDPLASLVGAAIAGGALGFLVFNWAPARVFMGDVGSGFLGYTFAGLPLLAEKDARASWILFVVLSLWLFLADATWTLLRRMALARKWYEPHREHFYQRLVISGWSHRRVSAALGLGSAVLTALAVVATRSADHTWQWLVLGVACTVFAAEVWVVRRREREAVGTAGE